MNQGFSYYFCLSIEGSGFRTSLMDPDPGGPKAYGSGSGSGPATLAGTVHTHWVRQGYLAFAVPGTRLPIFHYWNASCWMILPHPPPPCTSYTEQFLSTHSPCTLCTHSPCTLCSHSPCTLCSHSPCTLCLIPRVHSVSFPVYTLSRADASPNLYKVSE